LEKEEEAKAAAKDEKAVGSLVTVAAE